MTVRPGTTRLLTLLVLAAALGVGLVRKGAWRAAPPAEPQEVVYAMLAAARAGEVKAYLACFTGPMQAALNQSAKESGDFSRYLRETQAGVKGVAVSDAQKNGEQRATLRVEYVYQDRNEAQMLSLEKSSQGWKIARAENADRVPTLIPYGTPVK